MEIGEAVGWIDENLEQFLRRLMRDFFDFHTAFSGGDDDGPRAVAVEENGEIVFFFNFARDGEIDRLNLATGGSGLDGD